MIQIDCHTDGVPDTLVDDVRDGLTRPLKELPPKYFYDQRGSELFDQITTLPEYYPTRCEREILNRRAPELVSGARSWSSWARGWRRRPERCCTRWRARGRCSATCPFDVDASVVEACADELTELYPGLEVHGVVGDFEQHLERLPDGDRRLFAFLGGTIGNLYPAGARRVPGGAARPDGTDRPAA